MDYSINDERKVMRKSIIGIGEKLGYVNTYLLLDYDLMYRTYHYITQLSVEYSRKMGEGEFDVSVHITERGRSILSEESIVEPLSKIGARIKSSSVNRSSSENTVSVLVTVSSIDDIIRILGLLRDITISLEKGWEVLTYDGTLDKMSYDELLALYLISVLHPEKSKVDLVTISSKLAGTKIRDDISRLLKYEVSDVDFISSYSDVVIGLIASNIIRVYNGKILVNNRPIEKLLGDIGYNPEEIKEIVKTLLDAIVERVMGHLLPVDIVRNKIYWIAWKKLGHQEQIRYLDNLSPQGLQNLIDHPEIKAIFTREVETFLRETLKTNMLGPSEKTRLILKYYPQILGIGKVKTTTIDNVTLIDAGKYYAHVVNLSGNTIDFILYRKDTMIGVMYSGKTLVEAIMKAEKTYDNIYSKGTYGTYKISEHLSLLVDRDGEVVRGDIGSSNNEENVLYA